MNQKTEKIVFYSFLLISFLAVSIIDISANATFGSGDGPLHYLIARYSWRHPRLLLDMWGKPFFTLVSSPFAQLGLRGMFLFHALCAAAVSFFTYKIAKKLNLKYAWTAPAFIFFSPVYFSTINTGLTQILFSCMFMLSVWLVFERRFILSAIVLSFACFVRPEAYLVLPLITLVYMIRRQFLAIPFLLTSFIIYTIIGYFYFHDILWIITNNYKMEENYLGNKGSFFHFIKHFEDIWGNVYFILLLLGLGAVICLCVHVFLKKEKQYFIPEELLLILGSFLGILLLHCLLYSVPGILNNLGLMHYMAALIPSSAVLAIRGLNLISATPLKRYYYVELLVVCVLIFFVVRTPFKQWWYPFRLNNEQLVLKKAGEWMKASGIKNKRICYQHPYLTVEADIDQFDITKTTLFWSLDKEHLNLLPDNTLIVWDSHASPQEGSLPLNLLVNDTSVVALKHYKYYDERYPFDVWVFMRSDLKLKPKPLVNPEIVTN